MYTFYEVISDKNIYNKHAVLNMYMKNTCRCEISNYFKW